MNEIIFEGEFTGKGYRSKFRVEDDGSEHLLWVFDNSADLTGDSFEFPTRDELMSKAFAVYFGGRQKNLHEDRNGQLWAGTAKEATNG